jgi:hypothetical protein
MCIGRFRRYSKAFAFNFACDDVTERKFFASSTFLKKKFFSILEVIRSNSRSGHSYHVIFHRFTHYFWKSGGVVLSDR